MTTRSVLLVDGYSLIHRGFHALPLLSVDGVYTNAVQGFFNMLFKAVADYRPDALCVMLDMHAPTFRHTMYDQYKAGRKPTPEELRPQFAIVREILTAMGIRQFELEGYEADDLLGSAAKIAEERGVRPFILTGDRDSLQLVSEQTRVILTRTGLTDSLLLTPEKVAEVYGFTPVQVPDMKGLMGDGSDNIPGVPGVGEKTALKLIAQYGTLENTLAHAGEVKGKLGEKLQDPANQELARLSKDLGTIRRSAPMDIDFDACGLEHMTQGVDTLQKYKLNRLSQQLTALFSDAPAPDAAAPAAAPAHRQRKAAPPPPAPDLPSAKPAFPAMADQGVVTDIAALRLLSETLESAALHLTDEGAALCAPDGRVWTVPAPVDMLGAGLYEDQFLEAIAPLLQKGTLIAHGAKALWGRLARCRQPACGVAFDTLIAAYLLTPVRKDFSLAAVLEQDGYPAPDSLAAGAYQLFALSLWQRGELSRKGMTALYDEMERPLTRVLFQMEREGFGVDAKALSELGAQFTAEIDFCRAEVYRLSGVEGFNLNSPKQLGDVLFETLRLPAPKKSKAGAYSTAAEVLESLDHPLIAPLLRYRKLTKLEGTYIEGLGRLIDKTGRVHTTFDQTATVTGRISSLEPNLQNIPVRSEEGREIRKAFVAAPGHVLVDADYSQIELRVLAHLSGDPAMQDAFRRGQDIHARTAAEVAGVPIEQVTPAMRRSAKAVNFGIVYGISGFGLARNIGVSRQEAAEFIQTYFERYPGVKRFMDECVRLGYERGYAETMFGRRRPLFELQSANRALRSFGERAAMNTPVQGAAADIIKLAMVRVDEELKKGGFAGKLILQVHDELVVECPEAEAQAVAELLQKAMEGVCSLSVPLIAEVETGRSWFDAK